LFRFPGRVAWRLGAWGWCGSRGPEGVEIPTLALTRGLWRGLAGGVKLEGGQLEVLAPTLTTAASAPAVRRPGLPTRFRASLLLQEFPFACRAGWRPGRRGWWGCNGRNPGAACQPLAGRGLRPLSGCPCLDLGRWGCNRWCPAGQVRLSKRLCNPVEDVFGELEATALEGGPDRRPVRVAEQEEDVDGVHVLLKETAAPRRKPPSRLDCLRNQTD
jgi:hypothetical protein